MSNNLACVGWFVAHQAELGQLVTRALRLPSARQLGERDGVAVWRADDPSGRGWSWACRAGRSSTSCRPSPVAGTAFLTGTLLP
jgi:hypothetical protein